MRDPNAGLKEFESKDPITQAVLDWSGTFPFSVDHSRLL